MPSNRLRQEYAQILMHHDFVLSNDIYDPGTANQVLQEMRHSDSAESLGIGLSDSDSKELARKLVVRPGLSGVLEELSVEIEAMLKRAGKPSPTQTLVAEFPTGCFNAQALRTDAGYIVLVNTGLMMLVHQVAKIMSFSVVFSEFGRDGKPLPGTDRAESEFESQRLPAMLDAIKAYLTYEDPSKARRWPIPGAGKRKVIHSLVHCCEQFVVAHEYAHIISGHFDDTEDKLVITPAGNIRLLNKTWGEEYEADIVAAEILLSSLPSRIVTGSEDHWRAMNVAAGSLFFFHLDSMITRASVVLGRSLETDARPSHPPSEERASRLRMFFEEFGGQPILGLSEPYEAWLDQTWRDLSHELKKEQTG